MSYIFRLPVVLTVLASAACSDRQGPQSDTCPAPRPAFSLLIERTDGGVLPADTTLTVSYGGSAQERFALDAPTVSPQVVFCRVVPEGAEADGGAVDPTSLDAGTRAGAVLCELWTDGAANVSIEATGLVSLSQRLEAQIDDCGIMTTNVAVRLQAGTEPGED